MRKYVAKRGFGTVLLCEEENRVVAIMYPYEGEYQSGVHAPYPEDVPDEWVRSQLKLRGVATPVTRDHCGWPCSATGELIPLTPLLYPLA